MANLHDQFIRYRKNIDISPSKKDRLKSAEQAVRNQLEKYFSTQPEYNFHHFKLQGSKSMGTLIRKNESVDIDLGIYFYPKPNVQPKTLMEHVYKALYGLKTQSPPVRKNKCIRAIYSDSLKIHIDVPIFYLEKISGERDPHLATKDGWIRSNITEFEKWFTGKKKGNIQLSQIVRYLKDWGNNQVFEMPNGVIMTVLAAKYQVKNQRDDIAFLETLKKIREALIEDFSCEMPAVPYDDLLRSIAKSNSKRNGFFRVLDAIIDDGEVAVRVRSVETAVTIWKKHLGKNFNK
jgi:hypothetical protein